VKVLLTGGAGYVGSACLRWLLRHGHDPIAYDNLREGNREAVPDGRLVVGDILDTDRLVEALRDHGIEAVMHFAAAASVPESIRDPELYWRTNLLGTKSVLDAMRRAEINRIVFSSTAAIFSFDEPMPLAPDAEQKPAVPYGTSKLTAEWIIKDYANAYGLGYALLRYFNASGADPDGCFGEDRRSESHLIPLILFTAMGRREKVFVYGGDWDTPDGTCVRDYIHTDDLASAHQLTLESLRPGAGRAYNIGTGRGVSVMRVLKACEEVVGSGISYEVVGRRPGDPAVLIADPKRIRNELGWAPRYTDIHDIVATAWRWHSTHPGGYRSEHVAESA